MSTKSLIKKGETIPSLFDDFFRPWSEWLENGSRWMQTNKVPAVNVAETPAAYKLTLAAPGLKKEDFSIDLEGNMLTIGCEKQDTKSEEDTRFTRKEYNYTSFSRSFSLPSEINQEKIEASYTDGILSVNLPKKEDSKKAALSKSIKVG